MAGQSYASISGNLGRYGKMLNKQFFCIYELPWIIGFYMHYDVWNSQNIGLAHIIKVNN